MIICIYGDYGVGKDTFADILLQAYHNYIQETQTPITVKKIKSYTTRKPRYKNEQTHTFITKKEWKNLKNFVATTKIGNEYYGATTNLFTADYNIYVINGAGIEQLLKYNKKHNFEKILIIEITRDPTLIKASKKRINREKVYGNLTKEQIEQYIQITIENNGSKKELEEVTQHIPYIIPYFKTIE